ncbi:MAG: hypothetical protein E6H92_00595 [Chloroflexi bacterium]|nr:MAG: hypothetical protein E6H92_00595 [Chloroflexota bacterium]
MPAARGRLGGGGSAVGVGVGVGVGEAVGVAVGEGVRDGVSRAAVVDPQALRRIMDRPMTVAPLT